MGGVGLFGSLNNHLGRNSAAPAHIHFSRAQEGQGSLTWIFLFAWTRISLKAAYLCPSKRLVWTLRQEILFLWPLNGGRLSRMVGQILGGIGGKVGGSRGDKYLHF